MTIYLQIWAELDAIATQQPISFKCQVTILDKVLNLEKEVIIIVMLTRLVETTAPSMTILKETSIPWHQPFIPATIFHQTSMTGVMAAVAKPMLSTQFPIWCAQKVRFSNLRIGPLFKIQIKARKMVNNISLFFFLLSFRSLYNQYKQAIYSFSCTWKRRRWYNELRK